MNGSLDGNPLEFASIKAAALCFILLASGCSDTSTCASCQDDEIDPSELVDPRSLGDGSGYPGSTWTVAPSPAALGWSRTRLEEAGEMASAMGSDAFMVVDRGVSVWEYGRVSKNYVVQSSHWRSWGSMTCRRLSLRKRSRPPWKTSSWPAPGSTMKLRRRASP